MGIVKQMPLSSLTFGKTFFYVSWLFILRDDLPAGQIRMFTRMECISSSLLPLSARTFTVPQWVSGASTHESTRIEKEVGSHSELRFGRQSGLPNIWTGVTAHFLNLTLLFSHLRVLEDLKRADHRDLLRKREKLTLENLPRRDVLMEILLMSFVLHDGSFGWVSVVFCPLIWSDPSCCRESHAGSIHSLRLRALLIT